MNEPIHIGEAVKSLRKLQQLTREGLAARCSLHEKTIYLIEKNQQEPKIGTLYALATGLELEFLDFMREINYHYKTHA